MPCKLAMSTESDQMINRNIMLIFLKQNLAILSQPISVILNGNRLLAYLLQIKNISTDWLTHKRPAQIIFPGCLDNKHEKIRRQKQKIM